LRIFSYEAATYLGEITTRN